MADTEQRKQQFRTQPGSLLKAAGLIAVVTIFSKFTGFLRDWQIFHVYGLTTLTDAYFSAVQLPWFTIVLLGGLGGPFHTATVAVFARLIKDGEPPDDKARKLASGFMTLAGLIFLVLSLLIAQFAEPIMGFILNGASSELITASAEQLKIMTPAFFLGGLIGIFYGLLNVYQCFFWPSLSPAAMNLVMIGMLFFMPFDPTGRILAWATVGGALAQFVIQLPEFFKFRFSLAPAFQWRGPEMRQLGEILFPLIIGTTIGQLMVYVDMFFIAQLPEGGWGAVALSNRLVQLPIGVLQTALLVPIFPRFIQCVEKTDWNGLRHSFKTGVVSLWAVSIPMLVVMLLYMEPLIRIVFQHGRFDAEATHLVSLALIFQAFQMLPYFARDSITRVFYAFHDSKTPMFVGLFAIFMKAFLDWLLVKPFGVGGITLSTTLITLMNMTLLWNLSRRHIDSLGFREMVGPFIKLMAAGAVMMAAIFYVISPLTAPLLGVLNGMHSQLAELSVIALNVTLGAILYLALAHGLHVGEVQYITQRVMGVLKRSN